MGETATGMEATGRIPEPLAVLAALVNSNDIEGAEDHLSSPDELRHWLIEHDLIDRRARVSLTDVDRTRRFREALREAGEENAGHRPATATHGLDAVAAEMTLRLRFDARPRLEPAQGGGVDAALATMLGSVFAAMLDGTWSRFKACGNDECRWAFYDTSRNRSGQWCSMAVCGNRMKGRAFRRRHRVTS
jgi:predicted RNA-binding Zn ribbon-like protein